MTHLMSERKGYIYGNLKRTGNPALPGNLGKLVNLIQNYQTNLKIS